MTLVHSLIYTDMCNHRHSEFWNIFIVSGRNAVPLAIPPLPHYPSHPTLSLGKPLVYALSLWISLFRTFPLSGIICCVVFCVWLLSVSMFSRTPFPGQATQGCTVRLNHSLFIRSSADGHLGGFPLFFAVMNHAAITFIYKFLCGRVFSFLLGLSKGEKLQVTWGLCLTFGETARPFSKQLHHFMLLWAAWGGYSSSTSLPALLLLSDL